MQLTWLDPSSFDQRSVAEAVALLEDARLVDSPHELSWTVSSYSAHLRHGWDGDPPMGALARTAEGRAAGVLEVHLPTYDNKHLGFVLVTVDPAVRRQGIGRELFSIGSERVKEAGRTVLMSDTFDPGPGVAFLEKMGLKQASKDVERRQLLQTLDNGRIDSEFEGAKSHATAYELVRIATPIPEELIDDVVRATHAINDAPTDDLDLEDEVFSPERIRAFEAAAAAAGRRLYRLAVRHRDSGDLAGHTIVAVEIERPWYAHQYDTSVVRAHRGHRLGVLLKAAMLRWLREDEPQLRILDTWNAASNAHMIEVNEVLGYHVIAESSGWQRRL